MRGEWCYFKANFDAVWCNYIVEVLKRRPASPATIGVEGTKVNDGLRKSSIWFVRPDDAELKFIFPELWKLALRANDDWFGFHLSRLDYVQIARYESESGDRYGRHHDVFWLNRDPAYHRKLSCVVQLTNPADYDGGDLVFHGVEEQPSAAEMREQGTAVFFPSFVEHEAKPVVKGVRYSIAAWFDGPKWR
jgi:PKHD-type hydroxylase